MNRRQGLIGLATGLTAASAAVIATATRPQGAIVGIPTIAANAAIADAGIPASALPPQDRARRAWAEFSAAMREITADAHGWFIAGGGDRKAFRHLSAGSGFRVYSVHYETDTEPRCPRLIVEQHREIKL